MAGYSLRCPNCETRVRIAAGKRSALCPECGDRVRVPDEDDPDEDDRPRRRRDEPADEDDRPRRRRSDPDEDDRPRRRRRAAADDGEGPWLAAVGAAAGCLVLSLLVASLAFGTRGLPAGNDGPGGKLFGLGVGFFVSLLLMPLGTIAVKNKKAVGRFGFTVEGNMAVVTGFVQACIGGVFFGFCSYGIVFTLIKGQ